MCGESGACVGYPIGVLMIELLLIVVVVVGLWKLFTKAGKPGWSALIPIYNTCMVIDMAGKPIWWIILLFIPFVNIVVSVLVAIGLAKNFGRGTGTVIGLIFLPMIFILILAFSSAEYKAVE